MSTPNGDGNGTVTDPGTGDNPVDPTAATTDGGQATGDNPVDPADLQKEIEKWKALSRKHETRAKENSTAATAYQKLQDSQKSELQLANEKLAQAEAERNSERAERYRLLAATQHGLTNDLVGYLGEGDEAEIGERAANLSKFIDAAVDDRLKAELVKYGINPGQAGSATSASAAASLGLGRRPVESLRPGSQPASNNAPQSTNDMFRNMLGRG